MSEICPGEEQLSAHLDGELAGDEARRLERHLSACDRCHHRFQAMERLSRSFRPLGAVRLPVDLSETLRRRVGETPCGKEPALYGWRPWKLLPLSVAAAVALTFGALLGTALMEQPQNEPPTAHWLAPFEPIPLAMCIGSPACKREG